MKTHQCEVHDYISEVSERADMRLGSPQPLGKQIKFTFYWPDVDHWEGKDFVVRVGSFHRDGTASDERSETDEK
jgi:hypothetical protein